jgi:hypothetical protein
MLNEIIESDKFDDECVALAEELLDKILAKEKKSPSGNKADK